MDEVFRRCAFTKRKCEAVWCAKTLALETALQKGKIVRCGVAFHDKLKLFSVGVNDFEVSQDWELIDAVAARVRRWKFLAPVLTRLRGELLKADYVCRSFFR